MSGTILLVDGDPAALRAVGAALEQAGFEVARELDGPAALEACDRFDPDVAVIGLAGAPGQDLLLRLRDRQVAVVMLVDAPAAAAGVAWLRLGAAQVVERTPDVAALAAVCAHEGQASRLRRAAAWPAGQDPAAARLASLGSSSMMRAVAQQIHALAQSERATLLIQGEAGVGKRWAARLIHDLGPRPAEPLLEVPCQDGATTTLEARLFGYERGAIAAARRRERGALELAGGSAGAGGAGGGTGGGTVVLAEVHALPAELQPVVLRTLETGTLRRMGGFRDVPCRARVIATTSRDLRAATEGAGAGGLREDLANRLRTVVLTLPPVRERTEHDRLTLLTALHARLAQVTTGPPPPIDPAAMERLLAYSWPGNVREMVQVLDRAALLAREAGAILVEHLPGELRARPGPGDRRHQPMSLEELERLHIDRTLRFHGGNRTRAARELRISRATLINKIKRYGLIT